MAFEGASIQSCVKFIVGVRYLLRRCVKQSRTLRTRNLRLSARAIVSKKTAESAECASAHKIKANRANARASTGPRTARGKSISAQNARRHGLSLSVVSDPVLSEGVEVLARQIAGEAADDNTYQLARRIADAQVDLLRIRDARHQFLSNKFNDPYYDSRANLRAKALSSASFCGCFCSPTRLKRPWRPW